MLRVSLVHHCVAAYSNGRRSRRFVQAHEGDIAEARSRLQAATQRLQETWHALSPRAQAMCMAYVQSPLKSDVFSAKIHKLRMAEAKISALDQIRHAIRGESVGAVRRHRTGSPRGWTAEQKMLLLERAKDYACDSEASKALGIPAAYLSDWRKGILKMGTKDLVNRDLSRLDKLALVQRVKDFPTRGAAARALGVREGTLRGWMRGQHLGDDGKKVSLKRQRELVQQVRAGRVPSPHSVGRAPERKV